MLLRCKNRKIFCLRRAKTLVIVFPMVLMLGIERCFRTSLFGCKSHSKNRKHNVIYTAATKLHVEIEKPQRYCEERHSASNSDTNFAQCGEIPKNRERTQFDRGSMLHCLICLNSTNHVRLRLFKSSVGLLPFSISRIVVFQSMDFKW